MEKISMIIPVYNGRKHIGRCLKSIAGQTCHNIELLIMDDGSEDGSYEYLQRLIRENLPGFPEDMEVRLYSDTNHGVAYTRNKGIELATGTYVMFIDQDDFIAKDYCEAYVSAITESRADIVVGGYERVGQDKRILKRMKLSGKPFQRFLVMAPWAHIYRRDFLLEHDITFLKSSIGEDVYFNFLAYSHTDRIRVIGDTGYKWYYNELSVSNSRQNTMNQKVDPIYLLEHILKDTEAVSFTAAPEAEYYFARYICWYMLFSFRGSRRKDIREMYRALHGWLDRNFVHWKKNPYLKWRMPEGEDIKIYGAVRLYYALYRVRLLLPVLEILR